MTLKEGIRKAIREGQERVRLRQQKIAEFEAAWSAIRDQVQAVMEAAKPIIAEHFSHVEIRVDRGIELRVTHSPSHTARDWRLSFSPTERDFGLFVESVMEPPVGSFKDELLKLEEIAADVVQQKIENFIRAIYADLVDREQLG